MIVIAKKHVLVDCTQNPPVPVVDENLSNYTNRTKHGVLIENDNGISYLDVIEKTNDNGCNLIETELKHWLFVESENTWFERDTQKMDSASWNKYVKSQNYNIHTTRDKLLKLVPFMGKQLPYYLVEGTEEFINAWGEDGEPIAGYYRAYDFFNYNAQDFPKVFLQVEQIKARYPNVGESYDI